MFVYKGIKNNKNEAGSLVDNLLKENVGYVKIILKKIVLEIEMVNNISADALQVRLFCFEKAKREI